MAILRDDDALLLAMDVPDMCFICGQQLTTPCIWWNGVTEEQFNTVWAHKECASRLAIGLSRDVLELKFGSRIAWEAWSQDTGRKIPKYAMEKIREEETR